MVLRGVAVVAAALVLSAGCSDSDDLIEAAPETEAPSTTTTATAGGCEDSDPATCTLRELADQQGILIGAAMQPGLLEEDTEYAEVLGSEFNSVTPENAYKWPSTEPESGVYTWEQADAVAEFAVEHGQRIRGHTLVWPNSFAAQQYEILPTYVVDAADPDTLQRYVDEHIEAVVKRYADVTDRWDVVNELLATGGATLDSNILTDTLGEEWIVRAFQQARELDPDAALYLNENLAERPGPKHDSLMALVGRLLEAGAPIDGIGLQGHSFTLPPPSAEDLTAVMEDWEALGLEVAITELDIIAPEGDLEAQAQSYADVFSACLAVAACNEITLWGVSDAHSWLNGAVGEDSDPLLFDDQYQRKPAYRAVAEVLAAGS